MGKGHVPSRLQPTLRLQCPRQSRTSSLALRLPVESRQCGGRCDGLDVAVWAQRSPPGGFWVSQGQRRLAGACKRVNGASQPRIFIFLD